MVEQHGIASLQLSEEPGFAMENPPKRQKENKTIFQLELESQRNEADKKLHWQTFIMRLPKNDVVSDSYL